MNNNTTVSIIENKSYENKTVQKNINSLLSNLGIRDKIKPSQRVLVKVNMACTGARAPEDRFSSHPAVVEAVIRFFQDCGATVAFGDDVARAGRFCESIWTSTGMLEVSKNTGAELLDFVDPGGREVKSTMLYPKKYLITNAYYNYDYIVNLANCRSHVGVFMSGAIKNMFGFVVGMRKYLIHRIFNGDNRGFSRALANIHSVIPAHLSILDLTSVHEGDGKEHNIVDIGYILAGKNPGTLDSIASWMIGYDRVKIWTTHYAEKFGLGSQRIEDVNSVGIPLDSIQPKKLIPPTELAEFGFIKKLIYSFGALFLSPRAEIYEGNCVKCGKCAERCPVDSIKFTEENFPVIIPKTCADCMCCIRVCENEAIKLKYSSLAKVLRVATGRPIEAPISRDTRKEFRTNLFPRQ
ncbi:MAG: DUF362 domain-containing protein [bacterium]|nr:DUF362 domain-containing protein [bacterium]